MADAVITITEYTTYSGIAVALADEPRYEALIQAASDFIVSRCNNEFTDGYPTPVKLACAQMVTFEVDNADNPGLESESQGGWSWKRGVMENFPYPPGIWNLLSPYCFLNLAFGTINYKCGDKRGRRHGPCLEVRETV